MRKLKDTSQSAIELYRGDLLSDFYDDWVIAERERYRLLYLDMLLSLVQAFRSASDYERAIEFAQKVLATEPSNERAHQHLMFAYLASGDRLAALRQYEQARRVLETDLAVEPSAETTALFEWIKQAPAERTSLTAQITNLPIPLSSFVGRLRELTQVKQLLSTHRLLTLTGAGGSGKTRLAIQAATDLIDAFKDGVWWVDLAPLLDETLVPQAMAKALGVREVPNIALAETLSHFVQSKQLLLILDNCEHLIQACAQLAERLLTTAPHLKILATSREPLGISGEQVWQVPTLSLPDPQQLVSLFAEYEAVRLFVERARAVKSDFALTDENALTIAQMCRQLDGIPLAIELAAARVNVLSVAEIAVRLDDRFNLLTSGSRTVLPRQRTLRALIDWSYDLLSEDERALFRRLAVFVGGRTLDAAEAVCTGDGIERPQVLNLLTHLVAKSLLIAEETNGETRYRFLETIRQYALEKLNESGERERLGDRHLNYFLAQAETSEPHLLRAERTRWLDRLDVEHDNLRAALGWTRDRHQIQEALRLSSSLWRFWYFREYWFEGRRWLEEVLAGAGWHNQEETPPTLMGQRDKMARALHGLGSFNFRLGEYDLASIQLTKSIELWRSIGGGQGLADALTDLAFVFFDRDEYLLARACLEESIPLHRAAGDTDGLAFALTRMGFITGRQGDYAAAHQFHSEALALRRLGDRLGVGRSLGRMGMNALNAGNDSEAREWLEASLKVHREVGDKLGLALALEELGQVARYQDDDASARAYFDEALQIDRELGYARRFPWLLHNLAQLAIREGDLDSATRQLRESVAGFERLHSKFGITMCLTAYARIAVALGEMARAARLLGAGQALRDRFHFEFDLPDRIERERTLQATRAALGEDDFATAWEEGRALKVEEAIQLAMSLEQHVMNQSEGRS